MTAAYPPGTGQPPAAGDNGFGMSSAETGGGSNASEVRCPMCLDLFRWDGRTVYKDEHYADVSAVTDEVKREELLHNAFVKCPNPSGDSTFEHFLPLRYLRYRSPLVIGLVGMRETGKSTLLAVMVDRIDKGGLAPYGIDAQPLHSQLHAEYRQTRFTRLLDEGRTLEGTAQAEENVQFAASFLLTTAEETRPIAFFDVGGESLSRQDRAPTTRFLRAVNALLFVADPELIEGRRDQTGAPSSGGDPAFSEVLNRLAPTRDGASRELEVPAAVVLAKADTLRFDPLIGPWLLSSPAETGRLDAKRVRNESRDVFAYLSARHADKWHEPFRRCLRCTLHVASATGGPAADEVYPRGLRPRRVLEPLISLIAMAGILTGPEAERIGR